MSCRCEDHLGNSYKSIADMCREWGVAYNTFHRRIEYLKKKNTEEKEAIKRSLTGEGFVVHVTTRYATDLDGSFVTVESISKKYGVSYECIYHRLKRNDWVMKKDMVREVDVRFRRGKSKNKISLIDSPETLALNRPWRSSI